MDGKYLLIKNCPSHSISPDQLYARLGTAASPLLVDVRRTEGFKSDDRLIVGALRRDPERDPAMAARLAHRAAGRRLLQSTAKTSARAQRRRYAAPALKAFSSRAASRAGRNRQPADAAAPSPLDQKNG